MATYQKLPRRSPNHILVMTGVMAKRKADNANIPQDIREFLFLRDARDSRTESMRLQNSSQLLMEKSGRDCKLVGNVRLILICCSPQSAEPVPWVSKSTRKEEEEEEDGEYEVSGECGGGAAISSWNNIMFVG
jgi:hypothetical protein